jgi:hypothetical protein
MAIVVECPRCRRATPFADNDAGLAVSCTACGQVTRVPEPLPKVAPPPQPLAYAPALGRVKGSGARPYVYAAAVVLAFGIVGATGFLRYRAMAASRQAQQAIARIAATLPVIPTPRVTARPTVAAGNATVVEKPTPNPVASNKQDDLPRVVGFVGLDRLELSGRYTVDSYDSATSAYQEATARSNAPLVSNLKVRLWGEGRVRGFVRVGRGGDFRIADAVKVSSPPVDGAKLALVPRVNGSAAKRANDNGQLQEKYYRNRDFVLHAGKTVAVPSGVYYLEDLIVEPKATLVLDGPVTFLVTGRLIVYGKIETHEIRPTNLRIRVEGENLPVALNTSSDVYVDLYAPGRTIEVYESGDIYGSLVGKILRVNGEHGLHFDESIAPTLETIEPRH